MVLVDYLGGRARQETLCHPDKVRRDFGALEPVSRRPCALLKLDFPSLAD